MCWDYYEKIRFVDPSPTEVIAGMNFTCFVKEQKYNDIAIK